MNTQGAPTTGLGQNVTFVGDPITGAPVLTRMDEAEIRQASPTQRQQVTNQYRQADMSGLDKTDAALGTFSAAIMGKIQEKEQQAFVSGAMDAAQGKTVEEVANEQPWYANLFGASSAELGAKAYHQQEKVNIAVASLQKNLPTLAQLPYEEAKKQMVQAMQDSMGKDESDNAFIRQAFMKSMPALVSDYTKLRIQHVNVEALLGQSRARRSALDLIEGDRLAVLQGRMTQEQADAMANSRLADTLPLQGQNLAAWEETFTHDLMHTAQQGKVSAVQQALGNGRDKLMDPANLDKVQQAMKTGNRVLREQWATKNAETLAQMEYDVVHPQPGDTVDANYQKLIDFAAQGTKALGATESVYDEQHGKALLKGGYVAVQQRINENAKKYQADLAKAAGRQAKADAQAVIDNEVSGMWSSGNIYGVKQYLKDSEIENRGYLEYSTLMQQNNMPGMADFLKRFNLHNEGYKFDNVAKQLQAQTTAAIQSMAKAGVTDAGLAQLYKPWQALNNVGLATLYFGEGLDGKMQKFHKMYASGNETPIAAAAAFEDAFVRTDEVRLSKDDAKKLEGGMFSSGMPEWNAIPEEARAKALTMLNIKDYPTVLEGVQRTLPNAIKTGRLEVFGKDVVNNRDATPVRSFLRDPNLSRQHADNWGLGVFSTDDKEVSAAFDRAVLLRSQGLSGFANSPQTGGIVPSTVKIVNSRVVRVDNNKEPALAVLQHGDDGKDYNIYLTMSDMYAARAMNYYLKHAGMANSGPSSSIYERALKQLTQQPK